MPIGACCDARFHSSVTLNCNAAAHPSDLPSSRQTRTGSPVQICRHWIQRGQCMYHERCFYRHPPDADLPPEALALRYALYTHTSQRQFASGACIPASDPCSHMHAPALPRCPVHPGTCAGRCRSPAEHASWQRPRCALALAPPLCRALDEHRILKHAYAATPRCSACMPHRTRLQQPLPC